MQELTVINDKFWSDKGANEAEIVKIDYPTGPFHQVLNFYDIMFAFIYILYLF